MIKDTKKEIILNLDGIIENIKIFNYNKIFLKYDIIIENGDNYNIIQSGISPTSIKNSSLNKFAINLNFNIDITIETYESWPKIIFSIYGYDYFNRNILIGFGSFYFLFKHGMLY